jgi:hypothetical protein
LDVAEGRIYISHDVVFDEIVYPFSKLNPKVGARFRYEILILPQQIQPPPTDQGDEFIDNSNIDVHVISGSTNGSCSFENVARNSGPNGAGNLLESDVQDEVYLPSSVPREQALGADSKDDPI